MTTSLHRDHPVTNRSILAQSRTHYSTATLMSKARVTQRNAGKFIEGPLVLERGEIKPRLEEDNGA